MTPDRMGKNEEGEESKGEIFGDRLCEAQGKKRITLVAW